ncbi:MAG: methylmalonyl-CoA mutase family protein [Bacteroidales bacterium]|jgi:methylmalonyl-CoA mutase|nr:methylmalonyl-CoA mutase family protein [Bacteroidales bacterium]
MSNEKLFSEFPPITTQQWEDVIIKDLKGADYEKKLVWKTPEGFKVKPYYREEDLKNLTYLQANPAEFPFVRGNSDKNNDWEIRQDACQKDLSRTNMTAVDIVKRGAQSVGLNVKNVKTEQDFAILLKDIDVTKVGIHFMNSADYAITLDLFENYLTANKISPTQVYGSIDFDFFGCALKYGSFGGPLEECVKTSVELFNKFATKFPKFRLLTVNAQLLHNSGATAVQELGYALNWANEYLVLLTEKGVDVNTIAERMTLHVAVGSNYFMEIAKIRAVRMLMANVLKAHNAKHTQIFVHASTSKWNKTIYDPNVNMLRTTTEAMSAALGGANSIHVDAYDDTYKCADEFSARIARNQQIILKEESYFDKIVDAPSGSYYIENLTDAIAQHAWKLFQGIEEAGGFATAFKAGTIQDAIVQTAHQRDLDIANRRTIILGTNQYPSQHETMLDKIESKCDVDCTCVPTGEYEKLHLYRGSEVFEELRLATERAVKAGKKKPIVFLLTYGNLAMRKARAGFALNFFGCAGYEIMDNAGFKTPEEGANAAISAKADIVVLCSSDEEYSELVNGACVVLKGKANITLAGHPGDNLEAFKAAGVSEFIHVRSNLIETLMAYQKQLEIL